MVRKVKISLAGILLGLSTSGVPFTVNPNVDRVCEIVVADDAIPAEETAAELLVRHLPKMVTGVVFRVVRESAAEPQAKRISVGWTKALTAVGIDCSPWGVEEELIAVRDGVLFVAGGRPRGTRYAAADFLERLGTVVTADDTEVDPMLGKIEWSRRDFRRKPAFAARYTATPNICQYRLNEFNKYNGWRSGNEKWGGCANYGKYGDCHTFVRHSMAFPTNDPAVFAFSDGVRKMPLRQGEKAPLCPTYPGTLKLMISQLEDDVAASYERERRGLSRTPYYEISMDDNLTACECPTCRAVAKEEGGYAGVMLRLANPLARRLAELDPEAKLTMLAYQLTMPCPVKTRPEPNILPRLCVQDVEWDMNVTAEAGLPLSAPENARFVENLDRWTSGGGSFGIWEYWEYYTKGVFPYVFPRAWSENISCYRRRGAENVLVEMELPTASFYAFKNWLALKLMDYPSTDFNALKRLFFWAHYGAAQEEMSAYFDFLAACCEEEMKRAPMGGRNVPTYSYLNLGFYRRAYELLASAERKAGKDVRSARHVRAECISLDRSLFGREREPFIRQLGLERSSLVGRMRRNEEEYLVNAYPQGDALKLQLKRSSDFLDGAAIVAPVPSEVKGDVVFDYKFNSFPVNRRETFLVDDPDALGGKAVEIRDMPRLAGTRVFHRLPFEAGTWCAAMEKDRQLGPHLKLESVPQDEKYHLHYIGKAVIYRNAKIWLHWSWYFQLFPADACTMTPDYLSDVWISIKFTGPAYVKGSTKPDAVRVDRILVAR